jgi:hypothetical protein
MQRAQALVPMDARTVRQQLWQALPELFPGVDNAEFRSDAFEVIFQRPEEWSAGVLGMPVDDRKAAIKSAVRGGRAACDTLTRCSNCTVCVMYLKVLEGAKWQLEVVPVVSLWCPEGATCWQKVDSRHSSYAVAAVHLFPMPLSMHAMYYNLLAPLHGNLEPVTAVCALQVRRTACNQPYSLLALLRMQPAFQAAL